MKHARSFTSASSRRKLPILALALLALAYCSIALLTSALATPRSHSAGASSSSAAWLVDRDGAIYSMGGAPDYGSASNQWASPIVGMATTPNDGGYWEVARDGRIYPFGNAGNYGSASNEWYSPIVGMAATPDGQGYWEVAADGRIYAFGDAGNYGSAGSQHLNAPIVGMAVTPDGKGYWEVASDGGIFNYGNAGYYGSTGSIRLNQPVVGMATTPDGGGYWMAARDGGVFSFGNAAFYGATPARDLAPISAITATPDGEGYLEAATDGALYPHGDAASIGSTSGMSLGQPVVGAVLSVVSSIGSSTTPTTQPPTTTTTDPPTTTTTDPRPAPSPTPATTSPTTDPPAPTTTTTDPPAAPSSSGEMAAPAGYSASDMVLDDQFANLDNWNTYYGPGTQWNNKGDLPSGYTGGNQPDSNDECVYSASQDTLMSGGGVSLNDVPSSQFASQGYSESCGVLTSKNTLPSGGWYVQVKAQMPDTSGGMWPAIWALPSSSAQELDGFEGGWPGSSPNQQGHSDTFASSGQIQQVWSTPSGANVSSGYNTYGFQYIPGTGMRFYFNGTQVYSSSADLATENYYLFLQLQVASSQTSGWHTTGGSGTGSMKIAEVQVYS